MVDNDLEQVDVSGLASMLTVTKLQSTFNLCCQAIGGLTRLIKIVDLFLALT